MSTVEQIEAAIEQLPADAFKRLRRWIAERDARQWDAEIASDAQTGKFDQIRRRVFSDDDSDERNPLWD